MTDIVDADKLVAEYREAYVNGRVAQLLAEVGVMSDSSAEDDSQYVAKTFECPGT